MTWVVLGMERVPSPEPADTRGGIGGIFAFWNGQKTALGAGFAMGAPESPQDVACSSRLLQLLARPAPLPAARERSRDVHLASTRAETGGVAGDRPPIWICLICREILPGQHRA